MVFTNTNTSIIALLFALLWLPEGLAWVPPGNGGSKTTLSAVVADEIPRRQAISSVVGVLIVVAATGAINPLPASAESVSGDYHFRDRQSGSKDYSVIREDYYYMMGKTPPRLLNGPLRIDDPQWNAFGTCETTSEGGSASNSCTYVSLKQRIPAYSKYAFNIALGAKEYGLLGKILQNAARTNSEKDWQAAASFVTTLPQTPPPPPVDALLKSVLFASLMLTSPNFTGLSRELLVARFYANEASFATKKIAEAISSKDSERALAAWEFGKDSWNSYFQVVNGRISAKVGDKFEPIQLQ
jgi:hypothetical protein